MEMSVLTLALHSLLLLTLIPCASNRYEKVSAAQVVTNGSVIFENPLYLDSAGSAHFHLDDGRHVAARPGPAKMEPNERDMILTRLVGAPQVSFARSCITGYLPLRRSSEPSETKLCLW